MARQAAGEHLQRVSARSIQMRMRRVATIRQSQQMAAPPLIPTTTIKKGRFVYEHFYSLTKYMEILLFSQLASRHQLQLEIDKVKQLIYSSVFLVLTIVMLLPLSRIWSSFVMRRPSGVFSYSVTSSSNMLTKSSKPSNVPTISLSFFIIMWILEPMHLSTNSAGKRLH